MERRWFGFHRAPRSRIWKTTPLKSSVELTQLLLKIERYYGWTKELVMLQMQSPAGCESVETAGKATGLALLHGPMKNHFKRTSPGYQLHIIDRERLKPYLNRLNADKMPRLTVGV